jgi:hypothetical protein
MRIGLSAMHTTTLIQLAILPVMLDLLVVLWSVSNPERAEELAFYSFLKSQSDFAEQIGNWLLKQFFAMTAMLKRKRLF